MIIRAIQKNVKLSKKGTPFASVSIQFDEYVENGKRVWINGFGNKYTWAWKIGEDVQPTITQEGKYYNFTFCDEKENKLDVYRLPATVGLCIELFNSIIKSNENNPHKKSETTKSDDRGEIPF